MTDSSLTARQISISQQQQHDGVFPLVLDPGDRQPNLRATLQWLRMNRADLLQATSAHGALLLRGFPVHIDVEFDAVIQTFDLPGFTYAESLSNAVRRNRTERVFTANEAPSTVSIYLHHEMAQTPVYPSRLFFFCEHPAETGGATPLCRSDILLDRLTGELPEFIADCASKGVRYANVMPPQEDLDSGQGRSWRSTLNAVDKAAAEAKLHRLGYQWEWLNDESLKAITPVLPAIRELTNGRKVFFNQLIAAFRGWQDRRNQAQKSISFGDGSPIGVADMDVVNRISDELTFDLCWEAGDVVVLDNFLVMHGRRPYGGERRVLAGLAA